MTERGDAPAPGARRRGDPLELAYRLLSQRDRTTVELARQLRRRGVEQAVVGEVIGELSANGYLDDDRYAQRYAEDRRALDGWGSERIAQGLRAAGIGEESCERAVAPHGGAVELNAAVSLLARRVRSVPADDRERQRALGLLVRKGYELELAYEAVRRFEQARPDDE